MVGFFVEISRMALFRVSTVGSIPLQTTNILRDRAGVARRAHNPKVVGSNPPPATKKVKSTG